MHIIAGLGNPGEKYHFNRHNIGFLALDMLHKDYSFPVWRKKFDAEISEGHIKNDKVLLVKPQSFMNLSGNSVGKILHFYKLTTSDLTIIHDDLDLAPGKIRLKNGGGSGGHNGLKSIDSCCGKSYDRLRLGIGRPLEVRLVQNYVLGNFSQEDKKWLDPLLSAIAQFFSLYLAKDHANFLNKISCSLQTKI